ncbi:hypothetical protein [Nocardia panacis]|uniref:hypothetical protein n=1 Tax=Nocardia panacis TaxID=2340916 RepID=UPI0011C4387F|nr:hypothetical protein [Nocardia panacis]
MTTLATILTDLRPHMRAERRMVEQDPRAERERAELAALGGVEAARRGWSALRSANPNHYSTTGTKKVDKFEDLPLRLQVQYAQFAHGVLTDVYTAYIGDNGLRVIYRDGKVWSAPDA